MSQTRSPRTVRDIVWTPWQREEIRYLLVGGFNTVVGFALYAGFHAVLGRELGYLLVLIPSYCVGIVVSYITQRYLVFGAHGQVLTEFFRFNFVQLGGLGLNALAIFLIHETTPIPPVPGQAIASIVIPIATYFSHKFFTFRHAKHPVVPITENPAEEPVT